MPKPNRSMNTVRKMTASEDLRGVSCMVFPGHGVSITSFEHSPSRSSAKPQPPISPRHAKARHGPLVLGVMWFYDLNDDPHHFRTKTIARTTRCRWTWPLPARTAQPFAEDDSAVQLVLRREA